MAIVPIGVWIEEKWDKDVYLTDEEPVQVGWTARCNGCEMYHEVLCKPEDLQQVKIALARDTAGHKCTEVEIKKIPAKYPRTDRFVLRITKDGGHAPNGQALRRSVDSEEFDLYQLRDLFQQLCRMHGDNEL